MPKYSACIAVSIEENGTCLFDAESDLVATAVARRQLALWREENAGVFAGVELCPEWELVTDYRVIEVKNEETGEIVAEGISLDEDRPRVLVVVRGDDVEAYVDGDARVSVVNLDRPGNGSSIHLDESAPMLVFPGEWRTLLQKAGLVGSGDQPERAPVVEDDGDTEHQTGDGGVPTTETKLTNEQFILRLMRYSRQGALMQAFMLQALAEFAKSVAQASDEGLSGDRAMVVPSAWRGCAVELLAAYEANYGRAA